MKKVNYEDEEYNRRELQSAKIESQYYRRIIAALTIQTNSIVWEINRKLEIIKTYGPFEKLLGFSMDEMREQKLDDFIIPRSLKVFYSLIESEETDSLKLIMVHKDGKTKIQTLTSFTIQKKDGQVYKISCTSTFPQNTIADVILDNLNYGIIVLNNDSIVYLNKSVKKQFRYQPECISDILEMIDPEDRGNVMNEYLNVKKGGKLENNKFKLVKKNTIHINVMKIDNKLIMTIRNSEK